MSIAILTVVCLLMASPAYAYVDPGAGSMLVQLVTGGVAGGLVLVRLFWNRLRGKGAKAPEGPIGPGPRTDDSAALPPHSR